MEIDNIYNMDCLEGMKQIPDGTIDAVICDLPYGVLNGESEGGSWDTIIPFEPLWAEYRRVCKPTAAIVLFAQGMFTADLMRSNPKMWRYNLIWKKGDRCSGFLNASRMPLRNHEDIVIFYDKLPTYNPQMVRCEPHQRNHSRGRLDKEQTNTCYGKFGKAETIVSDFKYPGTIVKFPKGHSKEDWLHGTAKPVNLLRWLIRTYSNEGDLVLDNFAGSGSTLIAAIEEKRDWIGMELSDKYFEICQKRISDRLREPRLF